MHLEFEKPILELESKISELRNITGVNDVNIVDELQNLQGKLGKLLQATYSKLTPWQKVQVARHTNRPSLSMFIDKQITDFVPICGDRCFGNDEALITGMGKLGPHNVLIMGHEKGHDTESRIKHNFGMPRPEGYRKAARAMELADRFRLPIVSLVNTAGAYPGIDAEERGQAEAIAKCLEVSFNLSVPFIAVIVGEGGSGGAIAIAAANRVLMLEHAVYSVISPEGCASILWRSASHAQDAASAQKITAQDLQKFHLIDEIIEEPLGGAHRDAAGTLEAIASTLIRHLEDLQRLSPGLLKQNRRDKFLAMGSNLGQ